MESEVEPADSPASSASNRRGAYLFRQTAFSPGARRIRGGSAPSPPAACPRIARRVLVKGFVAKCNPQRYDESPGRGCGSPAIPETTAPVPAMHPRDEKAASTPPIFGPL